MYLQAEEQSIQHLSLWASNLVLSNDVVLSFPSQSKCYADCDLVMLLINGSNHWNDSNNTHHSDKFTDHRNVIMQGIMILIIWYNI